MSAASELARARDQFCQAIRGYSEDRWCAQWMRGVVDEIRKEGGMWLLLAAICGGWPIGLDGEDGWEPMTPEEVARVRRPFAEEPSRD